MDTAWAQVVIPNFVNIILAGDQPWVISDDAVITQLQSIWDHIYGMKVEFTIKKGTAPFDLVIIFNTILHTNLTYFSLDSSKTL